MPRNNVKLTERDHEEILRRHRAGQSYEEIRRKLRLRGVSVAKITIGRVVRAARGKNL